MSENQATGVSKPQPAQELRKFLEGPTVMEKLSRVLPRGLTPGRMIQQALTLAARNPELLKCSQLSILLGMIQSGELGLELSGPLGHAYLVPRWSKQKKCMEATFQVGYRGLIELAFRSGKVSAFPLRVVYEHDYFAMEFGSNQQIKHRPDPGERGPAVGYYAVCQFRDGGVDFEYMSLAEMVAHRNKYAAAERGPWVTDFDQMALKTVARRLCKRLPLSVEVVTAANLDEYHEAGVDHSETPMMTHSRTDALADRLDEMVAGVQHGDDSPQENEKT